MYIQLSPKQISEIKKRLDTYDDALERRAFLMKVFRLEPFIAHRKQFPIGDLPINCEMYEYDKNAPVIIFLPGIGTYVEMYCEFLYKLSQTGFNIAGIDIRGHGYSGGDRGDYTVDAVVKDLSDVVATLSKNYNGPIAIFGSSIGAPLALACAENDERIKALLCHTLFLTEYPLDFQTLSGWNMLKFSNIFFPNFRVDFRSYIDVNALVRGSLYGDFIEYDELIVWEYPIKTLADVYSHKTTLLHTAKSFKAAVITGEYDEIIKPEYIENIIQKMKHPFDFIVLPEARHMLPFMNIKATVAAASKWFRDNI